MVFCRIRQTLKRKECIFCLYAVFPTCFSARYLLKQGEKEIISLIFLFDSFFDGIFAVEYALHIGGAQATTTFY